MYRSDRQVTEDLIPVRFFGSILWHGLPSHEEREAIVLFGLVRRAEEEATADLDEKRKQKLIRRSWRVNDAILKPFMDAEAHVAKFGLITYYVLRRLVDAGRLEIVDGTPLDVIQTALLNEDGTLFEFANIKKIDDSAQKAARKVFAALQSEGLFPGMAWE